MDKKEVAQVLEEIALLLELAGENPFKVRAYESGARAVLTLPGDLEEAVRTGALDRVKGIGKSLSGIIKELVESGAARDPYELDLEPILEFAARGQVIMELNTSPFRLDLDWRWLKKAKELGVLISLNPDAHSLEGLDDLYYGVIAARKGWLSPEDVLNTYPAAEVGRLLKRRRP
jgi:histidinol phosphatase-like PHP family hydrolase